MLKIAHILTHHTFRELDNRKQCLQFLRCLFHLSQPNPGLHPLVEPADMPKFAIEVHGVKSRVIFKAKTGIRRQ